MRLFTNQLFSSDLRERDRQRQLVVELQLLAETHVTDADHDTVAQDVIPHGAVLAIVYHHVQVIEKVFYGLTLALGSLMEARTLEDHVAPHDEMLFESVPDDAVFLGVGGVQTEGQQDVLGA